MRTNTLAVAALVATASLAASVPDRPRIYFPRQVKRFTNTTAEGDPSLPTRDSASTKKRDDLFPDLFASLTGGSSPTTTTSSSTSTDSDTVVIITIPVFPSGSGSPLSTTESVSSTATSTATYDESSSSSTGTGALLFPTLTSTSTSTSTSDDGGILPPVTSLLGDLTTGLTFPTPNVTESVASETITSTSAEASYTDPASETITTTSAEPSHTDPVTSSTETPFLPTDLFPSETSSTATVSATSTEETPITDLPTSFPGTGFSSTYTTEPPMTTDPPVQTTIGNGTESSTLPPDVSETTSSSVPTFTDPPPGNVTSTASDPPITTDPPGPTNTSSIYDPPITTDGLTSVGNVTVTPTSSPPESITETSLPWTSMLPTGTITGSDAWLAPTIIVQPSSSVDPSQTLTVVPTSIPSGQPDSIVPEEGPPAQPADTTLIQLAFKKSFAYSWLVSKPQAVGQIYRYVPEALAFAGGYDISKAVMHSIVYTDTYKQPGYFTSLALVYVPSASLEQLRLDHKIASSALYQNPVEMVYNLTAQINPAFDITPGSGLPGEPGSGGGVPTVTPYVNDPFSNGGSTGENAPAPAQQGTTAAIALGITGLASAYGAAMFLIARRYKRRKQRHQRSSSVGSPSDMRQTGSPALMGGALLSRDFSAGNYGGVAGHTRDSQGSGRSGMNNSGRTAYISAPVAAENSLGWN